MHVSRVGHERRLTQRSWLVAIPVAILAFAFRLSPVLRGGGLFGLGDYDDGVYFSAAVGLVHGRLPYRDFLLLHPPGIVLALAPFAALGRVVGDADAFAVARVGWMALGALNAVLVVLIARRLGLWAAAAGGVFYALYYPAVYGEHTTQLEGLGTTFILIALLLLSAPRPRSGLRLAWAGAALGASAGVKIWGVVAVVIAVGWLLSTADRRKVGWLGLGAVTAGTAICLPFFLVSPTSMFRMVVLDQLGRPVAGTSTVVRLGQMAGLATSHSGHLTPLLAITIAAFGVAAIAAATRPEARLAVAMLAGLSALLLLTPSWFAHYASLIAGPAAVTVGAGCGELVERLLHRSRGAAVALVVCLSAVLVGNAVLLGRVDLNKPFPGTELAGAVQTTAGCVTSDDATTLVEMNVLGRDLQRGCPLIVDLAGHSYDDPPVPTVSRTKDSAWQKYAFAYLRGGAVVIVTHFSSGHGFSSSTEAKVRQWKVLDRIGAFVLRQTRIRLRS
jgi:alpha-1,2-mannosyltransferase